MSLYNKKEKVYMIDITQINDNNFQPRQSINKEKLSGLIQSINQNGIIQPLCVRKASVGYELICGHRRLLAAKALNFKTVPCLINDISNKKAHIFALIENIQREKLSFLEEAIAIDNLIKKYNLTQSEVAEHLGLTQPTVANKLRLLKLTDKQMKRLTDFSLTERHARALLRINDNLMRDDVLSEIIIKSLNVEQTEKLIDGLLKPKAEKEKNKFVVKDIRLFVNSINKAIKVMKGSGIKAQSICEEDDNFIKYTVTIPKEKKI